MRLGSLAGSAGSISGGWTPLRRPRRRGWCPRSHTGRPWARNRSAVALMCRNWASRSGTWLPARVLAMPWRLKPIERSSLPTAGALAGWPAVVSSRARSRSEVVVQRSTAREFVASPCDGRLRYLGRPGYRRGSAMPEGIGLQGQIQAALPLVPMRRHLRELHVQHCQDGFRDSHGFPLPRHRKQLV